MPGGPSAPLMISAPPLIVGDAIDYSTTDSHGVVTDDTLNLADTHGTVAPYSSTLAVGIDLSAIHISDWSAQTGMTVEYAVPNDFNHDGTSDIPFVQSGGETGVWDMSGTAIVGGGDLGRTATGWTPVATGDFVNFLGAGNELTTPQGWAEFLFQNAYGDYGALEYVDPGNGQPAAMVDIGNPGGNWALKGVGDFNGDGQSDLLLQDGAGNVGIWALNGSSVIGGGVVADPGGTWQFAGVGDYTGDGHADILFQDASGDLAIWEMNGTRIVGGGEIGNPGSQWRVLG